MLEAYRTLAQVLQAKLRDVPNVLAAERQALAEHIRELRTSSGNIGAIMAASRELASMPRDEATARERWTRELREAYERAKPLGGIPLQSQPFAGDPHGTPEEQQAYDVSRRNFLALMFCLMVGAAGLPHLLTRYYTVPSVSAARSSVAWSLFFIGLLYLSAPALAVMVKYEVMSNLVGTHFDALPNWMAQWTRVDGSLLAVEDINGDGILQFGEIRMGADLIILATPELGGMPYVVSGLVAAGGLAAALSTADGLLLTISNALVRDLYYQERQRVETFKRRILPEQRVILSKFALLLVALSAAFVAARRSADIQPMVSASFSLAASAFVPAMVMGIFWRGTTRRGAVAGMLIGLSVAVYYMVAHVPGLQGVLPQALRTDRLWWDIQPISAGVFGVPAGFVATLLFSWWDGHRALRLQKSGLDGC